MECLLRHRPIRSAAALARRIGSGCWRKLRPDQRSAIRRDVARIRAVLARSGPAAPTQLPLPELETAVSSENSSTEVVAYRSRDGRQLRCLAHAPDQNLLGLDWFALSALEVEGDASTCTEPGCGTDTLAERAAGA